MNNREVFDEIAPGWYNYRHWSIFRPELEALAGRWRRGRLLNLGCGHGPDFLPFRQGFDLHGVDFSAGMLRFARRYSRKFGFSVSLALADIRCLPYPGETFDYAVAAATYHHVSFPEQPAALAELRRVLVPGGEAFITVWNRCQPRFWFRPGRVRVPWRRGDTTLYRDYYLLSPAGLEGLVRKAGFHVLRSFPEGSSRCPWRYFAQNVCLLVKKE